MTDNIVGRALVSGCAVGPALLLDEPLSLWGGVELSSGIIVDASHPQRGETIAGRVLVMREARGSSSSSSALVELARRGLGPIAIVLGRPDAILSIGSLVAERLYRIVIPIVTVSAVPQHRLTSTCTISCLGDPATTITMLP